MTDYAPPIREMRFAMEAIAGLDQVTALPGCEDAGPELAGAVLEEAGRLAAEVMAPLNQPGDRQGSRLENGIVYTPDGWKEAYGAYVAGGWAGLPFDPAHGGQGLPWLLATPVSEMFDAANLAFSLCPLLSQGVVELLEAHGSPAQKARYLPRLVSGAWAGTMNLTEPQAGSDLAAIRTRAVPEDGHYRISGQKIFITYGDHDLTENIVHMVLARTPDAPAGVRGISLFIVPKRLIGPDGAPGGRNDLRPVSLEHKLGIHASPTCVMAYGDEGGATGELVGEENHGVEYMFTMMNNARLGVGLQGVAIAERAYQQARAYAATRIQCRADAGGGREPVAIIRHPDVRRMLLSMKSQTEAMRALAYRAAALLDMARRHPDPAERARRQAEVDFLIPIVKAWCTDTGFEIASTGLQVHGGTGYIEETGAAQLLRDVRIACIYEGTNGIQARDLVGRKLVREGGVTARALIAEMRSLGGPPDGMGDADLDAIGAALKAAIGAFAGATEWMLEAAAADPGAPLAVAAPYLRLAGVTTGGWLLGRGALAAHAAQGQADADTDFLRTRIAVARFYADHVLSQAAGLATSIRQGAGSVMALADDQL